MNKKVLKNALLACIFLTSAGVPALFAHEIHDAAQNGDVAQIQRLLSEDNDILQELNERGYSPLHLAAYSGHLEATRVFLDAGADINFATSSGSMPLHGAAFSGHIQVVRLLLDKGAAPDAANNYGYTPLLGSLFSGNSEIPRLLCQYKITPDARAQNGDFVLGKAVMSEDYELVKLLLDKGASTEIQDNYGRTALLLVARETGDPTMAKLLVDSGANVNARDSFEDTPIILAAWRGYHDVVNLLLDSEASLTGHERDTSLIAYSIEHSLQQLFTRLVAEGVDISADNPANSEFLHLSARGSSATIVNGLIERGYDIQKNDKYGWTPLHYAARNGQLHIVKELIDNKAKVKERTKAGFTPLDLAHEYKHDEVHNFLIESGGKTDKSGFRKLKGKYFGQKKPRDKPRWFAPDIVSSNRFEHNTVAFSPDGKEAFWGSSFFLENSSFSWSRLLTSRLKNGRWTKPEMPKFSGTRYSDDAPIFSSDGKKLYFTSRRPDQEGAELGNYRLWVSEREDNTWSPAHLVTDNPAIRSEERAMTITDSGNIYLSIEDSDGFGDKDVFVSRLVNGDYQQPENLGCNINSQSGDVTFVAPDESYMILSCMGLTVGFGDSDLYISFCDNNGGWGTPIILPDTINSPDRDWYAQVTHDGKYLFFNSHRNGNADCYWVSADIITELRKQAAKSHHATHVTGKDLSFKRRELSNILPPHTFELGLGDFDGDGDQDIVNSHPHGDAPWLWFNDGSGNFTCPDSTLTHNSHGVAIADLDDDNDLDIFMSVGFQAEFNNTVFLNDGRGNFTDLAQNLANARLGSGDITLGDLDNDGDLDAIATYFQQDNAIYLNDGKANYTVADLPHANWKSRYDLDGDGDLDIFVKENGVGYKTLINEGNNRFEEIWVMADSSASHGSIESLDVDNDGDLDILIACGGHDIIHKPQLLTNDGSGRFTVETINTQGTCFGKAATGDLNEDGFTDVVISSFRLPNLVLINDRKGHLIDSGLRLDGYMGNGVPSIADMDMDGDLDIVLPNFDGPTNSVIWFNQLK